MERPVFYDPSGKRRRWSKRILWTLLLIVTLAAIGFGATIVNVPAPDPLKIGFEREQPRALGGQIAHLRRTVGRNVRALTAWMPGGKPAARPAGRQLVAAFYVPWDDASRATLHEHVNQIDWVVAAMGFVTGPKHDLTYEPNALANRNLRAELAIAQHKPRLMVMIQNAKEGAWDSAGLTALLRDPKARAHLLDQVEIILRNERARGVTFDFEELPVRAQPYYRRFIAEAHARFAPKNWLVTLAVPVEDDDWNLKAYAKLADSVFLMLYDEHSNESEPGPIASQPWFVQRLRATVAEVGAAVGARRQ